MIRPSSLETMRSSSFRACFPGLSRYAISIFDCDPFAVRGKLNTGATCPDVRNRSQTGDPGPVRPESEPLAAVVLADRGCTSPVPPQSQVFLLTTSINRSDHNNGHEMTKTRRAATFGGCHGRAGRYTVLTCPKVFALLKAKERQSSHRRRSVRSDRAASRDAARATHTARRSCTSIERQSHISA